MIEFFHLFFTEHEYFEKHIAGVIAGGLTIIIVLSFLIIMICSVF